jgi:hypothetical protein
MFAVYWFVILAGFVLYFTVGFLDR